MSRCATISAFALLASVAPAAGPPDARATSRFTGSESCSSSGCHGGGGSHQNQFLVWSKHDFHSQRPYATLTTARSKQIADALGIADATRDARCTSCHAPLTDVPAALQTVPLNPREGVSCEGCHGPAEPWLRSHTRPDFTRADRVHAGLRDLRSLYVRANTCVACHQTVEQPLHQAGHPELIFELDGQCASQPRHWRRERDAPGPQAWLVGQAAALREASWQLTREKSADDKLLARWRALVWLLHECAAAPGLPPGPALSSEATQENFARVQKTADDFARRVSEMTWPDELTRALLQRLAGSAAAFRDGRVPRAEQARRAERLALALDRLGKALPPQHFSAAASADVDELFKLAQSIPDFDPAAWAKTLEAVSGKISAAGL